MENSTCRNCAYFRQHYIITEGRIFRISVGHCTDRQVRSKDAYAKPCARFLPGLPDEEQFVTKRYLSKQLLEYVLNMDLLPEIEDAPGEMEWQSPIACTSKKSSEKSDFKSSNK